MYGAIIGDIVGSRFEHHNHKSKDFDLFKANCRATDDSVMSIAIADAIMKCDGDYAKLALETVKTMQYFGRKHPRAGYGRRFYDWLMTDKPEPYNSYGNGSAMRVSACAYAAKSLAEAAELAQITAEVTHNHPDGINGAVAIATSVYLASKNHSKEAIREHASTIYNLDFTLDEIRESYTFDVSCKGSVPQAIVAFLEADSFEDAIRNAISLGGDSDTIAAMAGSIAEAYYGVPEEMKLMAQVFLDKEQIEVIEQFEEKYESGIN